MNGTCAYMRPGESVLKDVRDGPLTQVFGGPVAKVLDQTLYVGSMEQTIRMLSESTGLTYKTVQKAVQRLEKLNLMEPARKVANAQTYRFNARKDLHELILWAENLKLGHSKR